MATTIQTINLLATPSFDELESAHNELRRRTRGLEEKRKAIPLYPLSGPAEQEEKKSERLEKIREFAEEIKTLTNEWIALAVELGAVISPEVRNGPEWALFAGYAQVLSGASRRKGHLHDALLPGLLAIGAAADSVFFGHRWATMKRSGKKGVA